MALRGTRRVLRGVARDGAPDRPAVPSAGDAWRLLVRISTVRWAAVGLGIAYAAFGRPPGSLLGWLLAGVGVAILANTAVVLHARVPALRPDVMALVTVTVDYAWVTAAAGAMAPAQHDVTALMGYMVLASECGLLLGWSGAAAAVIAAIGGLVGLGALHRNSLLDSGDPSQLAYQVGAVAVAAAFAAVASAELRSQHARLVDLAASLAERARADHLTGLGNAGALDDATQALGMTAYGLLLVDIDGLRPANAIYGHQAGDEMLLGVAGVLAAFRGLGYVAFRLMEDKFVLLLPAADLVRTGQVGEEVRVAVHGVAVSAGELRVSVGCSVRAPGEGLDAVLSRADDALFAAKAHGGDRVVSQAEPGGTGRWRWRAAVESVLGSDDGVYAVYHAIVRVADGATVGWEALSRPRGWPPGASVEGMFLAAHRIGRGRELDWRCRRSALWEAARLPGDLFVNINLAALADPVHDVDQMLLLCDWATRDPRSVVLELSERDMVPNLQRLRRVLADYRAAGFRFAMDDVGEGQTTLELVLAARPEYLKLTQPLVQAARGDVTTRSAARALVTFAHDIGSRAVAEGVEDDAHMELCRELQIDLAQGWLFGRPLPADRLPGLGHQAVD